MAKTMNNSIRLERPSAALIEQYIEKYNADEKYSSIDSSLKMLFEKFPKNTSLDEVLLKATAVNSLYNTNIYDVFPVAKHIVALKVDDDLQKHIADVVQRIARLRTNKGEINFYSFATKYCSWHEPVAYPIYDSFVEKILVEYQKEFDFFSFSKSDLRDYPRFIEVLEKFLAAFGLSGVSLKELDKFLWFYAKELFPSQQTKRKAVLI